MAAVQGLLVPSQVDLCVRALCLCVCRMCVTYRWNVLLCVHFLAHFVLFINAGNVSWNSQHIACIWNDTHNV